MCVLQFSGVYNDVRVHSCICQYGNQKSCKVEVPLPCHMIYNFKYYLFPVVHVGSGRMLALSITSSHFVAHGQVEH